MGIINMGAGLSAMGTAIANTAGTEALELQKSQLVNQSAVLANQLATQRETGLEQMRETAQSGVVGQQEAGATQRAQIGAGATTEAAQIGAGATTQAAQIGAGSREKVAGIEAGTQKAIATMQIGATATNLKTELTAQGNQFGFDTSGNAQIINTFNGKVTKLTDQDGKPISSLNPAMVSLAISMAKEGGSALGQVRIQEASDLRAAEGDVKAALTDSGGKMDSPNVQAALKRVDDIKTQYQPEIDKYTSMMNNGNAILSGPLKNPGAAPAAAGANAAPSPSAPAASGMSGSGTKSDPYVAGTQAQIDWFKANAPAGAVISDGQGHTYTK